MWALVFLYLGRMRYADWILFAVTAIALYWVWSTDVGAMAHQKDEAAKREKALRAEADSLGREVAGRDIRLQVAYDDLKAVRAHYDSLLRSMLTAKESYIRHHAEAVARPLSDKWRYLGVVAVEGPTDSAR